MLRSRSQAVPELRLNTFATKTQLESALQRGPEKGAKEAFILRFLRLFAAFTIKCGFMPGENCVSFD